MPPADPAGANRLASSAYQLTIRQGPERAKVAGQGKEKDRKPIDPPPIIQLRIKDPSDPAQNFLQSPYYFVACNLWHHTEDRPVKHDNEECALSGTVVSSLHRLKDSDNADGGFFVFGDVSVKCEGQFRLRFMLFEMLQGEVVSLQSIVTDPFQVFSPKNFPGMSESTFLSRSFGDQGVRLRIRKETRKRPASRDANHNDSPYGQGRQDSGPMHHQMAYPQSAYGQPPPPRDFRYDHDEPLLKRQRSIGQSGGSIYDTSRPSEWSYSQSQTAPNPYPTHSQPTSSYAHVGASNPPSLDSFTFRPHPSDPTMLQSTYGTSQQASAYDSSRYPQHDAPRQYNDTQSSSQGIAQPSAVNRHANPAEHLQYQEINQYGAVAGSDQRDQKYQYPAPPDSRYNGQNGSILPPLPASGASAQSMGASASPYAYSSTYTSQPSQPPVQGTRAAYPGYTASYPVQTQYSM